MGFPITAIYADNPSNKQARGFVRTISCWSIYVLNALLQQHLIDFHPLFPSTVPIFTKMTFALGFLSN